MTSPEERGRPIHETINAKYVESGGHAETNKGPAAI
jgi:hypothetical protein